MNIVFDLGGVVVDWDPAKIARGVFSDEESQYLARTEILEHKDWAELDRGAISFDQLADRGAARSGLPKQSIENLLREVPLSLTPVPGTMELIHSIADSENRFYVLSNMHAETFAYLKRIYDIWDLFDGIVISGRIQMAKPDAEIFEYLLRKYSLDAGETVFIDDTRSNLEAAARMGIETIQFESADQCRLDLIATGCIR